MTVAFRFQHKGYPILVSDLLGSSSDTPRPLRSLTGVVANPPKDAKTWASGFSQKSVIFGVNAVLAWSGDADIARKVSRKLYEAAPATGYTCETFANAINSFGRDLNVIGFFFENNTFIAIDGPHVEAYSTPHLENFAAIGIGRPHLEGMTMSYVDGLDSGYDFEDALNLGLGFIGDLTLNELINSGNLNMGFGAGYELTSYTGGRFRKLDEVTYVFWGVFVNDGQEPTISNIPFFAYRNVYLGEQRDILIVRSVRFGTSDNVRIEDQSACMPPFWRDVNEAELRGLSPPSLNASILCNYMLLVKNGRPERVQVIVQPNDTPDCERSILFDDGAFGFTVGPSISKLAREYVLPIL